MDLITYSICRLKLILIYMELIISYTNQRTSEALGIRGAGQGGERQSWVWPYLNIIQTTGGPSSALEEWLYTTAISYCFFFSDCQLLWRVGLFLVIEHYWTRINPTGRSLSSGVLSRLLGLCNFYKPKGHFQKFVAGRISSERN